MIPRHAEYFREWLATFPEELFVILRVYADESRTNKAETLCGFIASPDYWSKFTRRWNAVLRRFCAPYFHFREFANPYLYRKPGNAYYGWTEKQRDSFLNELTIVLSEEAVPVGGCINMSKVRAEGVQFDTNGGLIWQFYNSVEFALNGHWPNLDGEVLFVFDETKDSKWVAALNSYHQSIKKLEGRIGGLSFENDLRCPPLQAADLFAYIARQQGERYWAQDKTAQVKRTLDWIISKNSNPKLKKHFTPARWERLVRLVLADRKRKKAMWAKQGQPKKQYFPEQHFDPKPYGLRLMDPNEL